jgi:multidrug resistance efflux pump
MDTISIRHKNFKFPFDELPILFLGDMESDFALFENAYMQYVLNKELQPFSNEAMANRISISELKRRLQSTLSQKDLYQSELTFKNKDLERYKTLFDKGVISAQEYENKQQALLQVERNYKNMSLSVSQIREAISTAKKTSRGTEINRTREDIVLLKNLIQSFNQLKKSIKDWELRYVLQSKINGKVSFLNYWNKNQTVNQGDLVFTIIPTENLSFIAKLKAPVQNSGKIKIGQSVNIKLQNYPETEFGMFRGTILSISLVPNNDGFYLIDVSLPNKLITSYNKEIAFKQEMRGTAEIITEDLRLIERFFYQFRNILNRE